MLSLTTTLSAQLATRRAPPATDPPPLAASHAPTVTKFLTLESVLMPAQAGNSRMDLYALLALQPVRSALEVTLFAPSAPVPLISSTTNVWRHALMATMETAATSARHALRDALNARAPTNAQNVRPHGLSMLTQACAKSATQDVPLALAPQHTAHHALTTDSYNLISLARPHVPMDITLTTRETANHAHQAPTALNAPEARLIALHAVENTAFLMESAWTLAQWANTLSITCVKRAHPPVMLASTQTANALPAQVFRVLKILPALTHAPLEMFQSTKSASHATVTARNVQSFRLIARSVVQMHT